MVRIAINGFGRIGRTILRAGIDEKDIEFVAINDITDIQTIQNLLKFDSNYGRFEGTIKIENNTLIVNNKPIKVLSEKDPKNLPWKSLNIDIVIESTGIFLNKEDAQKHIDAGAKKVILSAPPKDDIKTIVLGVNEKNITKEDKVISNASCTTNCLAPLVKILNDNFKIKNGFMTTIHAYTNDQRILDGNHKDLRRSRSAATNMIPTSTGAAKAIGAVIPELNTKLDGLAIRVPIQVGSLTDFTATLEKTATKEEINKAFKTESNTNLKGILEYSEDELVSSDIIKNDHSAIFDSKLTNVKGNIVKVVAWYDNEWGYSKRMLDLAILFNDK